MLSTATNMPWKTMGNEKKKILGKSVKLQEHMKFDRIDRAHAIENNDHLTDTSIVFNILIFKWMHSAHPRNRCLFGFEQTFIFTSNRLHAILMVPRRVYKNLVIYTEKYRIFTMETVNFWENHNKLAWIQRIYRSQATPLLT